MNRLEDPLPKNTLKWFAKAVAGMIASDGVVNETELQFLRHTLHNFLEHDKEVEELINLVKERKLPVLGQFKEASRDISFRLLINIIKIALLDDRLMEKEANYLKHVGNKLGFSDAFCQKILVWAKVEAKQRQLLENLNKEAATLTPEYN